MSETHFQTERRAQSLHSSHGKHRDVRSFSPDAQTDVRQRTADDQMEVPSSDGQRQALRTDGSIQVSLSRTNRRPGRARPSSRCHPSSSGRRVRRTEAVGARLARPRDAGGHPTSDGAGLADGRGKEEEEEETEERVGIN